jgi:uncharacterized protein (TIGR03435 family)
MQRLLITMSVLLGGLTLAGQRPTFEVASQGPLEFEVASVKASDVGGNYVEVTPSTVNVHSATLLTCITWAYSLQRSQVVSADASVSALLNSQRYDVIGKAGGPASIDQMRRMFQALLADRFKMMSHRDARDLQTFALVVDTGGPKFHESKNAGQSVVRAASKLTRTWASISMAAFADQLSEAMEAPVRDETGLTAKYDFALDLTPYLQKTGERPDIGAMMVTAIKEQLGLRMAPRRASVDVLVIDHLEKASSD